MKHRVAAALVVLLVAGITGVSGQQRATVDFRAEKMTSLRVGDSTALCLVGNVVFYHNGAVICCDSAVRYSDRVMDCYKHVVVNKDSTFIYGDRADYNGLINEARVYAPLIKMVDKDAVLYTRNFTFNTLTNTGRYYGGGTLHQKENQMESDEGFYYANQRELLGVRNVEMRNPTYRFRSDSVFYNLDSEVAQFRTLSYIWNDRNEFLTARRGDYDSKEQRYTFTDSSYIMTPTREVWADTIVYHQQSQDALMLNNVQITDDQQRAMAFGDYARYWGDQQRALLARDPVVAGYEKGGDTLYMRSDSMFLYTIDPSKKDSTKGADSLRPMPFDSLTQMPSVAPTAPAQSAPPTLEGTPAPLPAEGEAARHTPPLAQDPQRSDSTESRPGTRPLPVAGGDSTTATRVDSLRTDSLALDSAALDTTRMTPQQLKRRALDRLRAQKETVAKAKKDQRIAEIETKIKARRAKESAIAQKLRQQDWDRQRKDIARRYLKGKATSDDSVTLVRLDSLMGVVRDSVAKAADSTLKPQIVAPTPQPVHDSTHLAVAHDSTHMASDTIQRIVRGYRNVRIFRNDVQAVCDSLVGFSVDSTLHLYIHPILWNEQNQVTSEVTDLFTRNQLLERALFKGDPMMVSQMQLDTSCFNQLRGKSIEALFDKGNIYRMNAVGNAQTYYYSTDDSDSTDVYINGFLVAESGEVSFYFENKELTDITYRIKPVCTIYPMEKIPDDQPRRMKGFSWNPQLRPTLKDVFTRTIRPSQRARYQNVPQPTYPITRQIDDQRKQLTQMGWIDRTDRYLSQEAVEFVHEILSNPKSIPTATPIAPEPAANAPAAAPQGTHPAPKTTAPKTPASKGAAQGASIHPSASGTSHPQATPTKATKPAGLAAPKKATVPAKR